MKDPITAPLPKVFSTSQITTYDTCPRRYCYQYVLRIPTLVKSEALESGSRVHAAIADGSECEHPEEQAMVDRARRILEKFPAGAVHETAFNDPNNPGRFYGTVMGERFVGIFDVVWPDRKIGVDWKTGKYNEKYMSAPETQAWILSHLFEQAHGAPLDGLAFVYLKPGNIHYAKSLMPGRTRAAAAERVARSLAGIRARDFPQKKGGLCKFCDHQGICRLGVGFA